MNNCSTSMQILTQTSSEANRETVAEELTNPPPLPSLLYTPCPYSSKIQLGGLWQPRLQMGFVAFQTISSRILSMVRGQPPPGQKPPRSQPSFCCHRQNLTGMVQQCLTSHSTHYRSFQRRFYGSDDPTNSVIALKDNGQSTRSRANLTRLSSLKGKKKDVSKKNLIYIQHHED